MGAGWVARRWIVAIGLMWAACACAQDQRPVAEPRYPPICKILYAELEPVNGALPESSVERHYRDNARIEKAMASCGAGKSVVLHSNKNGRRLFLIGPLRLKSGVTLVVEQGAALWGTRDAREYDVTPGSCGSVGPQGAGCRPLLLLQDAVGGGVMGGGVIDGRGGAKLLGQAETWWELVQRARMEGATAAVPRLLEARRAKDVSLYGVTLRNAAGSMVVTEKVDGFTAWSTRLDAPRWARGVLGFELLGGTTNVSIVDTYIRGGGSGIALKTAEAAEGTRHVTVQNVRMFNGQGLTIGNDVLGGVGAVRVEGLTIDGSSSGVRVRSDRGRGGLVDDVRFENVCMRGVKSPLVFAAIGEGSKVPESRGLLLRNVRSVEAGVPPGVTLAGADATHRLEMTLENVVIDGLRATEMTARHAVLTVRRGNVDPVGDDVRVIAAAGGGGAYACEASRFSPFPEDTMTPRSSELEPAEDQVLYVAADGTGDFISVQAAVNRVPAAGGVVVLAPGVYRERVLVRGAHVTLRGVNSDARATVIVSDGQRGAGGGAAATLTVRGDEFTAENITIENDAKSAEAQAFNITGDRNVLRSVRLLGGLRTAYFGAKNCNQSTGSACEAGRTYVVNSFIAGSVDFIYGDGLLYCDRCELHSTEHAMEQGAAGFITGQGKHYAAQASAFVFRDARLTADAGLTGVYLGEPWRDLSTVVFLSPQVGPHVAAAGFRERRADGAGRMATSFFRVFRPVGAPLNARALTTQEAAAFGVKEVLSGKDGWDPVR